MRTYLSTPDNLSNQRSYLQDISVNPLIACKSLRYRSNNDYLKCENNGEISSEIRKNNDKS